MGGMNTSIAQQRIDLFPITTQITGPGGTARLSIAGCDLVALAEQYGTPLYIYDRATLDNAVQQYRQALADAYPASSGITYAAKAFLCTAVAQWAQQQDLLIDCTGAGEIAVAAAAHTPRQNILVHGVNKSIEDLHAALEHAGILVVDNLAELAHLVRLTKTWRTWLPDIWLRLKPGFAVDTHQHRQTGQEDSKFGMNSDDILLAAKTCLENNLPLTGLHFHQGSHFHNPEPISPALETALDCIERLRREVNWLPTTLCPGGGWGVAYHEDELPHPVIKEYVDFVASNLIRGCRAHDLPLPHLQLEPGRSLVARGGVAIYRVGAIKHTSHIRWLMIDGGMADNPRPALYGARYSALPVQQPKRPVSAAVSIAGPFCESGDILIKDLPMPDIQPGEFLAIPVSGAYHLSMGSNYNGARKPAVLWLDDGKALPIITRQTTADLSRRDLPLG